MLDSDRNFALQVVALFIRLQLKYLECPSAHQHGVSRLPQNLDTNVAPKSLFEHAVDLFIFQLATDLLDGVEIQTLFSVSADFLNISIVF